MVSRMSPSPFAPPRPPFATRLVRVLRQLEMERDALRGELERVRLALASIPPPPKPKEPPGA
jgi:hypothetical protein